MPVISTENIRNSSVTTSDLLKSWFRMGKTFYKGELLWKTKKEKLAI